MQKKTHEGIVVERDGLGKQRFEDPRFAKKK